MKRRTGQAFGVFLLIVLMLGVGPAAFAAPDRTAYERANQMLPWNMRKLIDRLDYLPVWPRIGDVFFVRVEDKDGGHFYLVDPAAGTSRPAFDRAKLAPALATAAGIAVDPADLPINRYSRNYHQSTSHVMENARWSPDFATLTVTIAEVRYACDLGVHRCSRLPDARSPKAKLNVAPDRRSAILVRDGNIFLYSKAATRQLSTDGGLDFEYAKTKTGVQDLSARRYNLSFAPVGLWSPDSSKFLTHRLDERLVGRQHIIEATPADGSMRPKHHVYKYPLMGDAHIPLSELFVFDVATGKRVAIDLPPTEEINNASSLESRRVWWSKDSKRLYIIWSNRTQTEVRFVEADAATGKVRNIITETDTSPISLSTSRATPNVKVLESTGEIIWFSERDGWPHLYLYDLATGRLKRRLTAGNWHIDKIERVDEKAHVAYISATGRERGRNPYFRHIYRLDLNQGALTLLTLEDADHEINFSPSGTHFVDTYSRVDQTPVSVLRATADGKVAMELNRTDISRLTAWGWRAPEEVKVKAADGKTDLYGMIAKPSRFDAKAKYPVIDAIYPGPGIRVPHNFLEYVDSTAHPAALPELGFALVMIDARGTFLRDRVFRRYNYKNYHENGFVDHVAGIRQMAASRPYMDLDRVGVYGHSNGGTNTIRAMLNHPDFYDVGVASAASSDRRMHSPSWETTIGPKSPDNPDWELQNLARPELVSRFAGHMLVVMGELDDNVHPAQATRLLREFVKQNKPIDFFLLPGRNHDFKTDRYFIRLLWNYFVRHLAEAEPDESFVVDAEMLDQYEHPPLLFRPVTGSEDLIDQGS